MEYYRCDRRPELVSLESVLFTIEELNYFFTEYCRGTIANLDGFGEEYVNLYHTLANEIPSFIMNYCRIHRMGCPCD